jgi:hypothetical protein
MDQSCGDCYAISCNSPEEKQKLLKELESLLPKSKRNEQIIRAVTMEQQDSPSLGTHTPNSTTHANSTGSPILNRAPPIIPERRVPSSLSNTTPSNESTDQQIPSTPPLTLPESVSTPRSVLFKSPPKAAAQLGNNTPTNLSPPSSSGKFATMRGSLSLSNGSDSVTNNNTVAQKPRPTVAGNKPRAQTLRGGEVDSGFLAELRKKIAENSPT